MEKFSRTEKRIDFDCEVKMIIVDMQQGIRNPTENPFGPSASHEIWETLSVFPRLQSFLSGYKLIN